MIFLRLEDCITELNEVRKETPDIKRHINTLDSIEERLLYLKDIYKGETAYYVTAGPSLNIGEFSQVGDLVQDFASDSATMVIGTVIDPSMNQEVKVTVVATGLGDIESPSVVVDNGPKTVVGSGAIDYGQLDRPTYSRANQKVGETSVDASERVDIDYLDVPAFLRRQAD